MISTGIWRVMVKTTALSIFLLVIILLGCNNLIGCKGGIIPVVGDIEGPSEVLEHSATGYSISFVNGSDVTYQWSCEPADAGQFNNSKAANVEFTATEVNSDSPAKIMVIVNSPQTGPVIKVKKITVMVRHDLYVSEIDGPAELDEYGFGVYSVIASGDTGITYEWSTVPEGWGEMQTPDMTFIGFTAGFVGEDTVIKIQVEVNSDNADPIIRALDVNIKDVSGLIVGEIAGIPGLDENTSTVYSVDATGDTGITYRWSTEPESAGTFQNPDSAITGFHAGLVDKDTQVELSVEVNSDNGPPVIKAINITIRNTVGMNVTEIEGPAVMNEYSIASYSIEADGDTGITYEWSIEPDDAGNFINSDASMIEFIAGVIDEDTPMVIRVEVNSEHYDTVVRTLDVTILYVPQAVIPWKLFKNDVQRTGRTQAIGPGVGPEQKGYILYATNKPFRSSPVIGEDGTVYIGEGNGRLLAFNPDLTFKWQYPSGGILEGAVDGSPAIGPDGAIYFGTTSEESNFYGVIDMGTHATPKWPPVEINASIYASPLATTDGSNLVVFGTAEGFGGKTLYAITADTGEIAWVLPGKTFTSGPCQGTGDRFYIADGDIPFGGGRLRCVDKTGQLLWYVSYLSQYDGTAYRAPMVDANGNIYFGLFNGSFYRVQDLGDHGKIKWIFYTPDDVYSSPALSHDGSTVYGGCWDGTMYALNASDKNVINSLYTGRPIEGSAAIDGEGMVYFGSRAGVLLKTTPELQIEGHYELPNNHKAGLSSPAIASNGILFIGTSRKYNPYRGGYFMAITQFEE